MVIAGNAIQLLSYIKHSYSHNENTVLGEVKVEIAFKILVFQSTQLCG